jgi:hypothetical protein
MAYTINLTNGTIFTVIADGTVNTSSSLTLVGKNYAGYGQFLDENFIKLLENGANSTAPGAPLTGQLWFDTTAKLLKVYNGTQFKTISGSTASLTAPSSNVDGDLWYDKTNAQLKVYDAGSSSWVLIGPSFTAGTGTSGAVVDTVTDTSPGASHVIVKLFVNNEIVAIFSKDATFTPASAITGFATIGPGLNLSTTVQSGNAVFKGVATSANLLGNLASSQLMRSDTNTSTTGTLSVLNDTGAYVGANSDLRLLVSSGAAVVRNQTTNGNLTFGITQSGNAVNVINIEGSTGNVSVVGNLVVSGAITTAGGGGGTLLGPISVTSISNSNGNGVGNIGSQTGYFNTIFAKATSAEYADLAERFAADDVYAPGTVVELGGAAEITRAIEELSDNVFGVISTKAAYTMNGAAGSDETHPPIAMTGRVPVLSVGRIRKGDRLVSAGNGLARAAKKNEITAFNVIGRALEDKLTDGEGTVEAIVTIN